jgi:nicotinamide-nucleotide amidase
VSTETLHAEAAALVATLTARADTLAVAESLTGGMLAASLTGVPGASAVFRGGVAAYATDVKTTLLDVPDEAVRSVGVVSAEVAEAMAHGARRRLGSTYALSTTGVAGPDPQEGKPVGTVFVAVAGPAEPQDADPAAPGGGPGGEPGVATVLALRLAGDRQTIRVDTCVAALGLLRRTLDQAGTLGDA